MEGFGLPIANYLFKSSPSWNKENHIRLRIQINGFSENRQAHLNWV